MKSYQYKTGREELKENDLLWEEFESFLESIYFPGAAEILEKKLIAFEYEAFISQVSV
jgi:hypothetical protein